MFQKVIALLLVSIIHDPIHGVPPVETRAAKPGNNVISIWKLLMQHNDIQKDYGLKNLDLTHKVISLNETELETRSTSETRTEDARDAQPAKKKGGLWRSVSNELNYCRMKNTNSGSQTSQRTAPRLSPSSQKHKICQNCKRCMRKYGTRKKNAPPSYPRGSGSNPYPLHPLPPERRAGTRRPGRYEGPLRPMGGDHGRRMAGAVAGAAVDMMSRPHHHHHHGSYGGGNEEAEGGSSSSSDSGRVNSFLGLAAGGMAFADADTMGILPGNPPGLHIVPNSGGGGDTGCGDAMTQCINNTCDCSNCPDPTECCCCCSVDCWTSCLVDFIDDLINS